MNVIRDDLWFCVDCMFYAVNGDLPTDSTPEEDARIESGASKLGPNVVPDFDTETDEGHEDFARYGCDCCGSRLAGEMYRFAILG